jgi:hypothetical protein
MLDYNTKIEKYQGVLPKNKNYIFVKRLKCGNVIDVTKMTWRPQVHVKRLKGNTYVNITTGEVKEYMPKIDGVQMRNRRSLRMIFTKLRQLITTNFEGGEAEKFLTLTYAQQHNDPAKIYKDLDIFNKRLRRAYPSIGYLHIVEPHASGNYHVHSLLKHVDGTELNLGYKEVCKLWGHGYVTVEALNNVDNIGAYFVAYFSNLEIADEDLHKYKDDIKEMPRADGSGTKKVIKGARLDFYPDYMQIYRASRNLKKPEAVNEIDKEKFKKTYEAAYILTYTDENGNDGESYLKKEQWKKN